MSATVRGSKVASTSVKVIQDLDETLLDPITRQQCQILKQQTSYEKHCR